MNAEVRSPKFKGYLRGDGAAKELVDCYCGNVRSRKEIARLTGLTLKAVNSARERVKCKWKGFRSWEEQHRTANGR